MSNPAESSMRPNDADARQKALNPEQSYAVAAPAGSGKTELLIQRTLSLLSRVERPENILAITFTRKAANEMRERIVRALDDAANNIPLQSDHQQTTRKLALAALERDKECGWGLLENPARLRLQTIDALCRQLANQLCLETGLTVPAAMSEDVNALYQQAAEQTLSYIGEDSDTGNALRTLIEHLDGNLEKLSELIADLLASRDSWLSLVLSGAITGDYLEERTTALIEESLNKIHSLLAHHISDINGLLDYACAHREGADYLHPDLPMEMPVADAFSLSEWKAVRAFFLSGSGDKAAYRSVRGLNKRMGFPTESDQVDKITAKQRKQEYADLTSVFQENPDILDQLNRLAILPDIENNSVVTADIEEQHKNDRITEALFHLLPRAAADFELVSQSKSETDFTAVAIAALRALGSPENPTPLALRMDYRIQHILIDEFQDTSSMQISLLECLTAGWEPEDGRTIFIVGDGMQSIYSFRKANVSLFIRARLQGIGMVPIEPLDLNCNFRSEQQIVHWVNQSFSHLFPLTDNLVQGQVAFREAIPTRPLSDWSIDLKAYANAELEADAIAADIEAKIDKEKQLHSASAGSIAILVRGRSHLKAILPALRARSIQWQAQDIDPLSQRMAVMDIHSLTKALSIPADRIAWLAILRAPWAALTMSDLLEISDWEFNATQARGIKAERTAIWTNLKAIARNKTDVQNRFSDVSIHAINRLVAAFSIAIEQLGNLPLRENIEFLWNQLKGADGLLEERDHQDIDDYLNLVEKMESGGQIIDWIAFERRLEQLYSQPLKTTTSAQNPDTNDQKLVQIMTIHKSKGLEFDHVYLPSLAKVTGINDDPLLLWWQREYEDGSEGYLLAARPGSRDREANRKNKKQSLYNYLKEDEKERQKQETARLLYVACTRARKSLFLSASLKWNEEKELITTPPGSTLLAALWPLYQEDFCSGFVPEKTSESQNQNSARILTGIRRLKTESYCQTSTGSTRAKSIERHSDKDEQERETSYLFSDNYIARRTGDLIHHSLMRIVQEKIAEPSPEALQQDWKTGLNSLGLSTDEFNRQLNRLSTMLESTLADKTGRWILQTDHQDSAAELEIDYLDHHGSIRQAVIDRTFIETQPGTPGIRWIIDYKSSQPKNINGQPESITGFLQREANAYRPQLMQYVDLYSKMESRPCKAMLYFPSISASIEL